MRRFAWLLPWMLIGLWSVHAISAPPTDHPPVRGEVTVDPSKWTALPDGIQVQVALPQFGIGSRATQLPLVVWFHNPTATTIVRDCVVPVFTLHGEVQLRDAAGRHWLTGECAKKHRLEPLPVEAGATRGFLVDAFRSGCFRKADEVLPPGSYTVLFAGIEQGTLRVE